MKFHVGGRIFEVLREPMLSLHPGSLLHALADEHLGDDAIFVEANPDLFQYMLEHMRNRKIHIPRCVPRAAVLLEAAKLGFMLVNQEVEQERLSARELGAEARHQRRNAAETLSNIRVKLVGTAILSLHLKRLASEAHLLSMDEVAKESGLTSQVVRDMFRASASEMARWFQSHGGGLRVIPASGGVSVTADGSPPVKRRQVVVSIP